MAVKRTDIVAISDPEVGKCGNAATDFTVPHLPFNIVTLVAMIVPTRMCRLPHSRICLAITRR